MNSPKAFEGTLTPLKSSPPASFQPAGAPAVEHGHVGVAHGREPLGRLFGEPFRAAVEDDHRRATARHQVAGQKF
jgi:hypothetical protein